MSVTKGLRAVKCAVGFQQHSLCSARVPFAEFLHRSSFRADRHEAIPSGSAFPIRFVVTAPYRFAVGKRLSNPEKNRPRTHEPERKTSNSNGAVGRPRKTRGGPPCTTHRIRAYNIYTSYTRGASNVSVILVRGYLPLHYRVLVDLMYACNNDIPVYDTMRTYRFVRGSVRIVSPPTWVPHVTIYTYTRCSRAYLICA